ncbi:hypothetical protein ACS0TY_023257 [Phlomoides rotata]
MDLGKDNVDLNEEDIVCTEGVEDGSGEPSIMCLVGKVLTNKPFNAFGLLETMKKVMNPPMGFMAREIGKNLFSFQFWSTLDMNAVLAREPWLFEKNIVVLKELEGGEQPSVVSFNQVPFWVRMYDLPLAARSEKMIRIMAEKCGSVMEIDWESLKGMSCSVRAMVKVDLKKPLKKGINLEMKNSKNTPILLLFLWHAWPHEKKCDLMEGEDSVATIPDEKLPFGEWLRASPSKQATVSSDARKLNVEKTSLHRHLFERFKESVMAELNLEK